MGGTTLVAMLYGDKEHGGVVLAADSRCSILLEGSRGVHRRILSEEYVKIFKLCDKIYSCVSGNANHCESAYLCVQHMLRTSECMYGRSCLVREIAGFISCALAQDKRVDVAFIVGGWDEVSGPQIYHVKGSGMSENLEYKVGGSGSICIPNNKILYVGNSHRSKEETKFQVLNLLKMAVDGDPSTGGQLYTVVIDKTDAVKEVLSPSGEVIPDWGWM